MTKKQADFEKKRGPHFCKKKQTCLAPLEFYVKLREENFIVLPTEIGQALELLTTYSNPKTILERESLIENSKIEKEFENFQTKISESTKTIDDDVLNQRDELRKL